MKKTSATKSRTPRKTQSKTINAQPDRIPEYLPDTGMKTTPIPVPAHSSFTLPNGLKILFIPRKRLPLFHACLMIKTGALQDPPKITGCTNLTGNLLDAGVKWDGKTISKLELAERIDSSGGSLYAQVNHDRIMVTTGGLTKHSGELLDMLAAVVRYPLFPKEELARERHQQLAVLTAKRDRPASLVDEAFRKLLYPNHPVGLPTDGTIESVAQIELQHIVSQWQKVANPANTTLAIAGDFDPRQLNATITARFADWEPIAHPPEISEPTPLSDGVEIVIVNKPGSVQSSIQLGHHGIARSHPDFYALVTLEQILFSGMASRLYKVIRAERGLTYGIGGGFEAGKRAGPMIISTSTMLPRTGYMIASIFEVIEKFLKTGPTAKELMDAQMYLTGSYPLRLETSSSVMSVLLSLDWCGLPDSTISDYRKQIASLTRHDILRAAREHIHPEKMRIAIVGETKVIEPQLKEIGRAYKVIK